MRRRNIPFFKADKSYFNQEIIDARDYAYSMIEEYAKTEEQKQTLQDVIDYATFAYVNYHKIGYRPDELKKSIEKHMDALLDALEKIPSGNYEFKKFLNTIEVYIPKKKDYQRDVLKELTTQLQDAGFSDNIIVREIKPILRDIISGDYI